MKKKNLKLNDLKVQSFVTALNTDQSQTIQGGGRTNNPMCISNVAACVNTQAHFCTNFGSAVDACPTARGCTLDIDLC